MPKLRLWMLLALAVVVTTSCVPSTPMPTPVGSPQVTGTPTVVLLDALPPTATVSAVSGAVSMAALASPMQVLTVYNPAGLRADGVFVDDLLKRTMDETGKTRPVRAGDFPRGKTETVVVRQDAFSEINELFYQRGWTDGLPIVPPTEERVQAMLRGTDLYLSPDFVVATLEPMGGQATVEKIAVNAIMAGCRPEYMPILMAAVEALADPALELRSIATTTNPDAVMVIVSGPVVKQLGINASTNALGRGWQANATIGRALHLIIQNIGGSWPGVTDMSCLGHPGDFTMMLAENTEASPWPPLHMELGFPKAANVVMVLAAEGMHNLVGIGRTAEGYLTMVADHLVGLGRPSMSVALLIVAQDTAEMLAREGWTRAAIQESILERARMPYWKYKERFIDTGLVRRSGRVPTWVLQIDDPDEEIPVPFVDQFLVLVAGGPGEKSMLIPSRFGSRVVAREVRLPWNWEQLIAGEVEH